MLCENDIIVVHFETTTKRISAKSVGVKDWPPPEFLDIGGFEFKRTRYSKLSDEFARSTIYISRGAEYEPTGK